MGAPSTPSELNISRPKKAPFVKIRFQIVILTILCPIVCYISRQNLSLAIVSIVNNDGPSVSTTTTATPISSSTSNPFLKSTVKPTTTTNASPQKGISDFIASNSDVCPAAEIISVNGQQMEAPKTVTYGPRYNWEPEARDLVFSAFFVAYVIFQIPGTRVAEIFGAKWVLFTAGLGSAIISFLSPWAISLHPYAFCLLRFIMGVVQAPLFPACYVIFARWLPPVERSQAIAVLSCGAFIGSMLTATATGYFSEQPAFGWPWAFYMPGCVCTIWAALWALLSASEPNEHRYLSLEESAYIEARIEVKKASPSETKKSISWLKVIKSHGVWAFLIVSFASNWAFTIVLIQLPTYLNDILHVPPFKNGLINSVIYLIFCVSSPIVGTTAALLIETKPFGLTKLQVRKIFQSIAIFGQTAVFVALPYIGCNETWVLGMLYAQIIMYSFVAGSEIQIATDLTIDYAGTIYSIGNCIGSSTGFIVPSVKALMIRHTSRAEWYNYFYLAAGITGLGGVIFLILARTDLMDFSQRSKRKVTSGEYYDADLGDNCDVNGSRICICKSTKGDSFSLETRGINSIKNKTKQDVEKQSAIWTINSDSR